MSSSSPGGRGWAVRLLLLTLGAAGCEGARHVHAAVRDVHKADAHRPYLERMRNLPLAPTTVKDSWILEGTPRFSYAVYVESPDGKTRSGLWQAEGPARFEWHFDTDETVRILEGEVEIEEGGKVYTLRPGDTAFFAAGAVNRWRVNERVLKTFTLAEPSRLTRWLRVVAR